MSNILDSKITFVETWEEAQAFVEWLGQRRPILACDTETTGLQYWVESRSFVRLVQFGDAMNAWVLDAYKWRGLIELTLQKYDRPITFHNAKFDIKALKASNFPEIKPWLIEDTFLMDQIINPVRRHGLKEITAVDVDSRAASARDLLKDTFKAGNWDFATVPTEALAYSIYSGMDVILGAREYEVLQPKLGWQKDAYTLELQYSLLCAEMEYRGLKVDRSYLGRLSDKWNNDIADLKEKLAERGIEKPNSRLQVITSLEKEGWEPQAWTATGAPAVDKKVLEALQMDYDTAQDLLEYRNMTKRMANYIVKMSNNADQADHIHPDIRVMGARTGRSSITNPPLQQLPKAYEVRRAIVPDNGNKIWAIDYAAEEFLLLIGVSQDPVALELIESGKDVHRWVASQAYHKDYDSIAKDSKERSRSKNTLYASLYMAQAAKVAATAGIDETEAAMILEAINGGFSVMDTWRRKFTHEAESMEHPSVKVGDREIPLPRDRVFTTAVNTVIQGLGGQVLKRAALRIKSAGLSHHILIPVHDELVFQLPNNEDAREIAAELSALMDDNGFRPKLTTEISGPADSWGHLYERKVGDLD